MRGFYYLKIVQGIACFLVLCSVITTTELYGEFIAMKVCFVSYLFVADLINFSFKQETVMGLMKSMGGPCKQFLFYKSSQHYQPQKNYKDVPGSGITKRSDESAEKQSSGADSGRILAVFDGSKIRKMSNSTDELKLRGFLLFEWTTGGWFLVICLFDLSLLSDKFNDSLAGQVSGGQKLADKQNQTNHNKPSLPKKDVQFPNGTQIFEVIHFQT